MTEINPFTAASDRQLRKMYRGLVKQWRYYMENSYQILARPLETQMQIIGEEMLRRKRIRDEAERLDALGGY